MAEWICSDSDNLQYCRRVDDFNFFFIEARSSIGGGYIVSSAPIHIYDYTIDELVTECESYYGSLEDIFADYGVKEGIRIIAECIFEQTSCDEMEFNKKCLNLKQTEECINTLMNYYDSNRKDDVQPPIRLD